MSSLRRADLIVVTKGTGWDEQEAGMAELRKRFRSKEVTAVRFRPAALIDGVSGERVSADRVSPRRIVAVSGIADPAAFEMSLREMGFDVAGHVARPDHAWYRQEDWEEAVRLCRATGSDAVVTTEKDLVRLREIGSVCDPPAEYPRLFAAELEAVWQGEDPLAGLLARVRRLVEDARRQSRDGVGRT
jgi:tetraacyldisaccharide 4'-kinase